VRRAKRSSILRIPKRRADKLLLRLIRESFRFLSFLPHSLSARWAEFLFLTPPRQARTRLERAILARGRFRAVPSAAGRIATWRWGEGPAVLLVHGWGGHAGRLSRFVAPLTQAGFSVIAFDAPGHRASEGKLCSVPDFVGAVLAVAADSGDVAGLVGHSLGAAACLLAIRKGLRVRAAVLLAPLSDPERYAGRFANICRMPRPVCESMKMRLAARHGVAWEKLRLAVPASSSPARLLIVHDHRDAKVPLRDGRAIAATWPGARLVTTRGLGHHKILRSAEIIGEAVSFLLPSLAPVILPAEEPVEQIA
jgi:pimeloyl-ACP methyl ester carboxylesterase